MIFSLSPLDGRYQSKVSELREYFSEYALIKYRVLIEITYFIALSQEKGIKELPPFKESELKQLEKLITDFNEKEVNRIKDIEKETNHDVKAVEYYLKEKLKNTSLKSHLEFIHFAITSEDINNLAYGLMLKDATQEALLPSMKELLKKLTALAKSFRGIALMGMTHGQPATPTTVGKELMVFAKRLERQIKNTEAQEFMGKLNGATGNFNAQRVAYPSVNWPTLSKRLIQNLGLTYNAHTTQIEPHDYQSELYDTLARFNTILIDLNRDIWAYISRGIFRQKVKAGEVGSSTMPHKVNPIDFENSEGNLGMANALLRHFSEKLLISRLQRDLTDSTVQRNIGSAFGYSLLAYKSTLKGLEKLEVNKQVCVEELEKNWTLLAEPIQVILRKNGVKGAYEKLKELTRGKAVTEKSLREFISKLPITAEDKKQLMKLTPQTYLGLAENL